ncbi:MAG: 4a-hydroxytetrahydrobiopterin dehydratase [Candidatus Nitrosocosmicus sp.]
MTVWGFFSNIIDINIKNLHESHNHHPIIDINWKTVKISSKSFDANSISERYFRLANAIENNHKTKGNVKPGIHN